MLGSLAALGLDDGALQRDASGGERAGPGLPVALPGSALRPSAAAATRLTSLPACPPPCGPAAIQLDAAVQRALDQEVGLMQVGGGCLGTSGRLEPLAGRAPRAAPAHALPHSACLCPPSPSARPQEMRHPNIILFMGVVLEPAAVVTGACCARAAAAVRAVHAARSIARHPPRLCAPCPTPGSTCRVLRPRVAARHPGGGQQRRRRSRPSHLAAAPGHGAGYRKGGAPACLPVGPKRERVL